MKHSDILEKLLDECDKATDELMELNPDHEHLQYDPTNKSDEEIERLTSLLYCNFGPKGVDYSNPTEKVREETLGTYLIEVKAAIFIEKAKVGFLKFL